jgi:hypothetical protein
MAVRNSGQKGLQPTHCRHQQQRICCCCCRLRGMGLEPVTRDAAPAGKQYPYVLFAAPPSGSEDYPGAVSNCGAKGLLCSHLALLLHLVLHQVAITMPVSSSLDVLTLCSEDSACPAACPLPTFPPHSLCLRCLQPRSSGTAQAALCSPAACRCVPQMMGAR